MSQPDEKTVENNLNTLYIIVNDSMSRKDIDFAENLIKDTKAIFSTNKTIGSVLGVKKLKEYNQLLTVYETIVNRRQLIITSPNNSNVNNEITASGQRGIDSLKRSIALVEDTTKTATDTMEDLLRQREQIERARKNLDRVDENINESQRILSKMSTWWRRITT
jgi:hypothetical protein